MKKILIITFLCIPVLAYVLTNIFIDLFFKEDFEKFKQETLEEIRILKENDSKKTY
jgi:chloramphenicol O-acetyltransferase